MTSTSHLKQSLLNRALDEATCYGVPFYDVQRRSERSINSLLLQVQQEMQGVLRTAELNTQRILSEVFSSVSPEALQEYKLWIRRHAFDLGKVPAKWQELTQQFIECSRKEWPLTPENISAWLHQQPWPDNATTTQWQELQRAYKDSSCQDSTTTTTASDDSADTTASSASPTYFAHSAVSAKSTQPLSQKLTQPPRDKLLADTVELMDKVLLWQHLLRLSVCNIIDPYQKAQNEFVFLALQLQPQLWGELSFADDNDYLLEPATAEQTGVADDGTGAGAGSACKKAGNYTVPQVHEATPRHNMPQSLSSAAGKATVIPTGHDALDALIGGYPVGGVCILASLPQIDQTAFALDATCHALQQGLHVAYYGCRLFVDDLLIRFLRYLGDYSEAEYYHTVPIIRRQMLFNQFLEWQEPKEHGPQLRLHCLGEKHSLVDRMHDLAFPIAIEHIEDNLTHCATHSRAVDLVIVDCLQELENTDCDHDSWLLRQEDSMRRLCAVCSKYQCAALVLSQVEPPPIALPLAAASHATNAATATLASAPAAPLATTNYTSLLSANGAGSNSKSLFLPDLYDQTEDPVIVHSAQSTLFLCQEYSNHCGALDTGKGTAIGSGQSLQSEPLTSLYVRSAQHHGHSRGQRLLCHVSAGARFKLLGEDGPTVSASREQ